MKKLMLFGIVGSMFVVGQSLVFASGTNEVKPMELTKSIVAEVNAQHKAGVDEVEAVKIADLTMSTEAAVMISEEKAVEIAKVLGLDSKEIQKQSMDMFLENLSEEDLNKLVDEGIIEVMEAATMTEAMIGLVDLETAQKTDNMVATIEATPITIEAVKVDTNK